MGHAALASDLMEEHRALLADRLALIDGEGRYIGEEYTLVLAAAAGTRALAASFGLNIPAEAEPLHMNITEPTERSIPAVSKTNVIPVATIATDED